MAEDTTMAEKKLRGSGGYAIARVTDEEQKKGNLGGPELFLAGIGRLQESRFVKHYCNKCEKEYEGPPSVFYENPNEELGEGVTLIEKGEYKCKICSSTIAQYRKFDTTQSEQQRGSAAQQVAGAVESESAREDSAAVSARDDSYVAIQSLLGMSAYDSEAMLLGTVQDIGLRRAGGSARITIKVGDKEVPWDGISKIGDIVLLKNPGQTKSSGGKCMSCGYQNETDSVFCAECGSRL